MLGTRYEEYAQKSGELPFIFNMDIFRTPFICSSEKNWHEELEIQLCSEGSGSVLLNGEEYDFSKGDIVVVNSNVLHYTGTKDNLVYSCLIIKNHFLKQIGIDLQSSIFTPHIKSPVLQNCFAELKKAYTDTQNPCYIAILHSIVLKILIELSLNYSSLSMPQRAEEGQQKNVKAAIKYIRQNYNKKLSLNHIAKHLFVDKFALCRCFKRITGQTVFGYINHYRCQNAAEFIMDGYTVSEAAQLCGFENLSFFTKTFKRYMGVAPSSYKKK